VKHSKIIFVILILVLLGACAYVVIRYNVRRQSSVEFCEKKFARSPDSVKASNDMAVAYEKAGKHDEAAGVYNRMLERSPNNPDVLVNLAAIRIIKGDPEGAVELCEKAIAITPENATAHNNLAVAYYVEGEYELAIEHCDLAVKYGYKVKPELIELLRPYRE